jgi:hypothetical protein
VENAVEQDTDTATDNETGNAITGDFALQTADQGTSATTTTDANNVLAGTTTTSAVNTAATTKSGNTITGAYGFTETDTSNVTLAQQTNNGQRRAVINQTTTTNTTTQQTGNDITGAYLKTSAGTTAATLRETDTYPNGVDTVTQTDAGTSAISESGNVVTGAFARNETDTDAPSLRLTGNRGNDPYTQAIDTATRTTSTRSGNTFTGDYQVTQAVVETDHVTRAGTDGNNSSFGVDSRDSSNVSLTQSGNELTGLYTATTTTARSTAVQENGTNPAGNYSLNQTTTVNATQSASGNAVTGAYAIQTVTQTQIGLADQGVNATGTFNLTESDTDNTTDNETGNSITGGYSDAQHVVSTYATSLTSNAAQTNFVLSTSGTNTYDVAQTGSDLDDSYTKHVTGNDSYQMSETGNNNIGGNQQAFNETVNGTDTYTSDETGIGTKVLSRTEAGNGAYQRTDNGPGAQLPNGNGNIAYSVQESGDYRTGDLTLQKNGTDRYDLLEQFNDGSTTGNGNPLGTVDFTPYGNPFVVLESPAAPTDNEHVNPGQPFGAVYPAQVAAQVLDGSVVSAAATQQPYLILGKEVYGKACFAAGTPLLTPTGDKPIELFRVGDVVLSRSEFTPEGQVEVKLVEEVFVRTGRILHVHARGEVIRTTAEHPFYVRAKGWLPAGELSPGEELLSHDGRWVAVEDLLDTGEYEPVYNLRIADFHTYFVGLRAWGWSAWAHNLYKVEVRYADEASARRNAPGFADLDNPIDPATGGRGGGELKRTGNSTRLAKNMANVDPSSAPGTGQTAHHIIPEDEMMKPGYRGRTGARYNEALQEIGFYMNHPENGIALDQPDYHEAKHPAYSEAIAQALDAIPVDEIKEAYGDNVIGARREIADRVQTIINGARAVLEKAGTKEEVPLTVGKAANSKNKDARKVQTQAELTEMWIEALKAEGVDFGPEEAAAEAPATTPAAAPKAAPAAPAAKTK